jgi:hypothetical protein
MVAVPGILVVVVVLCLVIADHAVVSLLEDVRTFRLSREADIGLTTIDFEIDNLTHETERLQAVVSTLEQRAYPTLQQLKTLQTKHKLNLLQMERISDANDDASNRINYNTIMTGTVGSVIRFLAELEESHIVQTDQVILRPANEDGSFVALSMSVLVETL